MNIRINRFTLADLLLLFQTHSILYITLIPTVLLTFTVFAIILLSLYLFSLYIIFTYFLISIDDSLCQRISHKCTYTALLTVNILHLECWILTLMYHYSSDVSPLPCVFRTCLVSAAVPLQVPNPRHLVCHQLRSPVWSQPHSSSRHTCSALAQCLLTSRLKVSSPPHL